MKLYFIRHAKTDANMAGEMVQNYDGSSIISYEKPEDWEEKIGIYIPNEARKYIVSSPAKRCIDTAKVLFGKYPNEISSSLSEFDCKNLGNNKFWAITKDEFEALVTLKPTEMAIKAEMILHSLANEIKHETKLSQAVIVSHGMLIRYIYHYFTGHKDISAYEVINSVGFTFSNLDLLVVDTHNKTVMAHHYSEPVNHK